jgi:acetolactate synthase-1/2/3 large subunit
MAVDALPYEHPLRAGFIGSYGNRWANLAIGTADFLLVLGSRLDIRQTGADTVAFRSGKIIYQVDCDSAEVNVRIVGCRHIHADLKTFLEQATLTAVSVEHPGHDDWLAAIAQSRKKWPDTSELQGLSGINPNSLMHELSKASRLAAAFVVDVGNHQMWAAQSLEVGEGQRFITSGGMGAMGFALPAAIGACIAAGRSPIVVITGDGGMQVNLQELQTAVHHNLPIKLIVLNNGTYGMVRQFQQSYLEGRYQSTLWGYSAPDFAKVASAYGIDSATVSRPENLPEALERMWANGSSPYLLQVSIEATANAYPKIAFGRPITEMEPQFKPVDIEGT